MERRTLELARGALDVRSARGRSGTATTSRGHKNPFDLKSLRGRDQLYFQFPQFNGQDAYRHSLWVTLHV